MKCLICNKDLLSLIPTKVKQRKKFHNELLNDNIKVKPKVCYECFEQKYGKIKRALSTEQRKFLYNLNDEEVKKKQSHMGFSLLKSIKKNGEVEGIKKYEEYRAKQSESNTFDYKRKKYGMSIEEFNKYNKSRAVTKDNLIKKYGKEEGIKKYNNYVNKQKVNGCKLEYFVSLYGEIEGNIKYKELNDKKSISEKNFKRKYGDIEGTKKWTEYVKNKSVGHSKTADNLFNEFYNSYENKEDIVFTAFKNKEYGLVYNDSYYKYDYVNLTRSKVIEFNGDVFHANPRKYLAEDTPHPFNKGINARDIWEKDRIKNNAIKNEGFELLVIWEDELKDKDLVLEKMNEFIKGTL